MFLNTTIMEQICKFTYTLDLFHLNTISCGTLPKRQQDDINVFRPNLYNKMDDIWKVTSTLSNSKTLQTRVMNVSPVCVYDSGAGEGFAYPYSYRHDWHMPSICPSSETCNKINHGRYLAEFLLKKIFYVVSGIKELPWTEVSNLLNYSYKRFLPDGLQVRVDGPAGQL